MRWAFPNQTSNNQTSRHNGTAQKQPALQYCDVLCRRKGVYAVCRKTTLTFPFRPLTPKTDHSGLAVALSPITPDSDPRSPRPPVIVVAAGMADPLADLVLAASPACIPLSVPGLEVPSAYFLGKSSLFIRISSDAGRRNSVASNDSGYDTLSHRAPANSPISPSDKDFIDDGKPLGIRRKGRQLEKPGSPVARDMVATLLQLVKDCTEPGRPLDLIQRIPELSVSLTAKYAEAFSNAGKVGDAIKLLADAIKSSTSLEDAVEAIRSNLWRMHETVYYFCMLQEHDLRVLEQLAPENPSKVLPFDVLAVIRDARPALLDFCQQLRGFIFTLRYQYIFYAEACCLHPETKQLQSMIHFLNGSQLYSEEAQKEPFFSGPLRVCVREGLISCPSDLALEMACEQLVKYREQRIARAVNVDPQTWQEKLTARVKRAFSRKPDGLLVKVFPFMGRADECASVIGLPPTPRNLSSLCSSPVPLSNMVSPLDGPVTPVFMGKPVKPLVFPSRIELDSLPVHTPVSGLGLALEGFLDNGMPSNPFLSTA